MGIELSTSFFVAVFHRLRSKVCKISLQFAEIQLNFYAKTVSTLVEENVNMGED